MENQFLFKKKKKNRSSRIDLAAENDLWTRGKIFFCSSFFVSFFLSVFFFFLFYSRIGCYFHCAELSKRRIDKFLNWKRLRSDRKGHRVQNDRTVKFVTNRGNLLRTKRIKLFVAITRFISQRLSYRCYSLSVSNSSLYPARFYVVIWDTSCSTLYGLSVLANLHEYRITFDSYFGHQSTYFMKHLTLYLFVCISYFACWRTKRF